MQHWPLFVEISEMFILIPALLGLKGNLEMTLASRLSTAANLGELDTFAKCRPLLITNLLLVQV
jgi:solute carrier family 41